MAVIRNNPLLKGASGKLGRTLIYKQWRGQVVVAGAGRRRKMRLRDWTPQVQNFKEATDYAKRQMANPERKALYTAAARNKRYSASVAAVKDYLNPPKVHYVKTEGYTGAIGDVITIKATDDFKVRSVEVVICNRQGVTLEKGDAVASVRKPNIWKYQATVKNEKVKGSVIRVTALDHPKNQGKAEVVIDF